LPYELVEGNKGRCEIKAFNSKNRIMPEEISAKLLLEMKNIATERCGHPVKEAVITVPAYFTAAQKEATH